MSEARRVLVGITIAGAALAVGAGFVDLAFGETGAQYLVEPSDAGRLAAEVGPADGQEIAWAIGVHASRFLAYYWDRSPASFGEDRLDDPEIGDDEIVLVDTRRTPDWYPADVTPIAERGHYAVVTVGALRRSHP